MLPNDSRFWQYNKYYVVSGTIRFMRIFAGIPGEGASNDSEVIENVDSQGFRTLSSTP